MLEIGVKNFFVCRKTLPLLEPQSEGNFRCKTKTTKNLLQFLSQKFQTLNIPCRAQSYSAGEIHLYKL